jgi:hypothetical protein
MSSVLCASLDAGVFGGRQRHELLGRLSLAMKRVHLDLLDVRRPDLYTEVGAELRHGFEEVFDEVFCHAGELITDFDLTNQPYTFSYRRFARLNA